MEVDLFSDPKKWIKYPIPAHTSKWYQFRTLGIGNSGDEMYYPGGIGASEVSKLFKDSNPYRPLLQEIYHHKIGTEKPTPDQNELLYWGQKDEPGIVYTWQFWDGEPGSYVYNEQQYRDSGYNEEFIFRKAQKADYYLVNKKYPWLFISLDSVIPAGALNMITREPLEKPAPLECKTIGFYTGGKEKDYVPKYNIIQLHQQMMVTESEYGEIVQKRGGQEFRVHYYHRDDDLCNDIYRLSKDFWYNKVLPGRKLYMELVKAQGKGRFDDAEQILSKIASMEPEPDSSEAYKEYFAEKHQVAEDSERVRREGKILEYVRLKEIVVLREYIKRLKARKTYEENQIRDRIVRDMITEINFDDGSYFRFKEYKNGHRLYSELKDEPSEEVLDEYIKRIRTDL